MISAQISNCRKNMEYIQSMYEKVYSIVLQHNQPPLEPVRTPFTCTFFPFVRLFCITVCTMGVTALVLLCPLLRNLTQDEPQKPTGSSGGISISLSLIVQHNYSKWSKSREEVNIIKNLCLGHPLLMLWHFRLWLLFSYARLQSRPAS